MILTFRFLVVMQNVQMVLVVSEPILELLRHTSSTSSPFKLLVKKVNHKNNRLSDICWLTWRSWHCSSAWCTTRPDARSRFWTVSCRAVQSAKDSLGVRTRSSRTQFCPVRERWPLVAADGRHTCGRLWIGIRRKAFTSAYYRSLIARNFCSDL